MERFWSKVDIGGPDECWPWKAWHRRGYGQFRVEGAVRQAQRVSYEMQVGAVPPGLEVAHVCHNTRCVNPRHLAAVTHQENVVQTTSLITMCPRGHEYNSANTRVGTDGGRDCRACDRDRKRRARARAGRVPA